MIGYHYISLGILRKTHGVNGELVLKLRKNIKAENIKELELVFIEINEEPVPFFIESFSTFGNDGLIIQFEDIQDEKEAKTYTGNEVYIERKFQRSIQMDDVTAEQLVGYTIKDTNHGEIGKVDSIHDVYDNPLLRVINQSKEYLIPYNEDYIREIDHENKLVTMDMPEGLLELYKDDKG